MSVPAGTVAADVAGAVRGDDPAVAVLAAASSGSLPEDLRAAAKAAGAPRQVVRFLDGMALPAFVAGTAALDRAGVSDGERCGVFTVSGWDPDQHQPDVDDEPASYRTVARHYITTASPMTWLRKMVNNVLCQLAMVRDLRGPNNHAVGGSDALAAILALGQRAIATGAADHVLIVAYDAPPGRESDHEVDGEGAALVLGPADEGRVALPRTGPVGRAFDADPEAERRAVDVLDALIAATEHGGATGG
jgi:3-oxoacyl-(acyl-carrier-protein) synthase